MLNLILAGLLSVRQAVDPPAISRDRVRTQVKRGDLLVTIVGANTGDVAPVLSDLSEHYVCQSVALMRPVSPELTAYLNLYLNSDTHGRRQYEEFLYGAGRPHLSFDQLRATMVAVPPVTEQKEIVRRVDRLLALAEEVTVRVQSANYRIDRLSQAVLSKAFKGDLVITEAELARQERREFEPAVTLLERVMRQRRELDSVGRGRSNGRQAQQLRLVAEDKPRRRAR